MSHPRILAALNFIEQVPDVLAVSLNAQVDFLSVVALTHRIRAVNGFGVGKWSVEALTRE
jgi:hypothetical protein